MNQSYINSMRIGKMRKYMDSFRAEQIDYLRASEQRHFSPILARMLDFYEDTRIPHTQVQRIMLETLISREKDFISLQDELISYKIRYGDTK